MKRLIRYVLIGGGLLVAVIIVVLLVFREDLSRIAMRSTVEFAEETVVQNLPASESVDAVREEFGQLVDLLERGKITSNDLKPLLDRFSEAYQDQDISTEEITQILDELRTLIRR